MFGNIHVVTDNECKAPLLISWVSSDKTKEPILMGQQYWKEEETLTQNLLSIPKLFHLLGIVGLYLLKERPMAINGLLEAEDNILITS